MDKPKPLARELGARFLPQALELGLGEPRGGDAVELVVLLQRHYGIRMNELSWDKKIFYSIDSLARYVHKHMNEK